MIRTTLALDPIVGGRAILLLQMLLQEGFVIHRVLFLVNSENLVVEVANDEFLRLIDAPVEIDGSDHGFENVGKQTVRQLATAGHTLADGVGLIETKTHTLLRQRVGGDHCRFDLRQLTFRSLGEEVEEELGHDHSQHRVAEEFHALVAGVVDGFQG